MEIAALNHALEQVAKGHGQVVAVVGEAGIGKSRLVYEFVHSHRSARAVRREVMAITFIQLVHQGI
jgi:predicted ATPase